MNTGPERDRIQAIQLQDAVQEGQQGGGRVRRPPPVLKQGPIKFDQGLQLPSATTLSLTFSDFSYISNASEYFDWWRCTSPMLL